MFTQRASHWSLGSAIAAVALYFADAFEPDLESWEALN
jgi:hypothetical protein